MKLKDILAISGQQGLFKFVSKGRAGIIVESLLDGRRSSAAGNSKVNSLADVAVLAQPKDLPLYGVLRAIRTKLDGAAALEVKTAANDELTDFFAQVAPDYDREKVHLSDIRKILVWYNIMQERSLLDFEIDEEEESGAAPDSKPAASMPAHKSVQQNAPKTSTKAAGAAKIMAPRKAQ